MVGDLVCGGLVWMGEVGSVVADGEVGGMVTSTSFGGMVVRGLVFLPWYFLHDNIS